MASRMVIALSRSSSRAEKVAASYAKHVAEGLRPLLEAGLEPGETLPDVELFVRLLGRALERERLTLTAADRDQVAGNRHAGRLRKQRERLQADLRACLIAIRQGAWSAYGKAAGDQLVQIEGRLSRDPVPLARQAQDALRGLEGALAEGWKAPRSTVSAFDIAQSVKTLRAALRPFEENTGELVGARQLGTHHMAHKRRLYSSHRIDIAHVVRLLESILLTAGLPQEADDVRLRRRKKPRRPEETGPEALGGGEENP